MTTKIVIDNSFHFDSGISKVVSSIQNYYLSREDNNVEIECLEKCKAFSLKEQFKRLMFLFKNRKLQILYVSAHVNVPWFAIFFKNVFLVMLYYEDLRTTPGETGVVKKIIWLAYEWIARINANIILFQSTKCLYDFKNRGFNKQLCRYIHWPVTDLMESRNPPKARETITLHMLGKPRKNPLFSFDLYQELRLQFSSTKINVIVDDKFKKKFHLMYVYLLNDTNTHVYDFPDVDVYDGILQETTHYILTSRVEYGFSVPVYEFLYTNCTVSVPHNDFYHLMPTSFLYDQSDLDSCIASVRNALQMSQEKSSEWIRHALDMDHDRKTEAYKILDSINNIMFK
ncbi:hypothetical protein N9Y14_00560 [Alphaproteobacteria bacterium]|nr:hypothetical protein [Alphaproteobacteria bacterium]MDB2406724.1 hypothetical protein [Alphaproteobacteria bacterium]MDB2540622.1 hypothetical protein [Alphaproteobacteria bacterium]MDB2649019.1 hypothetical protein [Alphaproteobacteria bacterium]